MRARNLKPGFFKNEDLSEIEPLGRLLFQGLWCLADREGRLEDRPKRIKAELLPYDSCNVEKLLSALHDKNFIIRYANSGSKFIQITNFKKHQNPHMKEAESTIPAPDKPGTSTVQTPDENGSSPAESLFSDSPFSDSLNPHSSASTSPVGSGDAPPASVFVCPHFVIEQEYFEALTKEYPGLDNGRLNLEIRKAADWLTDNPDRHKRTSKGFIKNKRAFLRNWLERATVPGKKPGEEMPKWAREVLEAS